MDPEGRLPPANQAHPSPENESTPLQLQVNGLTPTTNSTAFPQNNPTASNQNGNQNNPDRVQQRRRIIRVPRGTRMAIRVPRGHHHNNNNHPNGRPATLQQHLQQHATNLTELDSRMLTDISSLQPMPYLTEQQKREPFRWETTEPLFGHPVSRKVPVDARKESLECVICYEFLQDPVTCGKSACTARFCRGCLLQATARPEQKRCPVCRSEGVEPTKDTVSEEKLKTIFTSCSYCFQPTIPLSQIQHHQENVCDEVRVACRLAPYGCKWTGRRGAEHHKSCPLEPFASSLLEQIRVDRLKQWNTTSSLLQQIHTNRALIANAHISNNNNDPRPNNAPNNNRWNCENPLHVLAFAFSMVTSSRAQRNLHLQQQLYSPMVNSSHSRAVVMQTTCSLPTFLMACKELRSVLVAVLCSEWGELWGNCASLIECLCISAVLIYWLCIHPGSALSFAPQGEAKMWSREVVGALLIARIHYLSLMRCDPTISMTVFWFFCIGWTTWTLPCTLSYMSTPLQTTCRPWLMLIAGIKCTVAIVLFRKVLFVSELVVWGVLMSTLFSLAYAPFSDVFVMFIQKRSSAIEIYTYSLAFCATVLISLAAEDAIWSGVARLGKCVAAGICWNLLTLLVIMSFSLGLKISNQLKHHDSSLPGVVLSAVWLFSMIFLASL